MWEHMLCKAHIRRCGLIQTEPWDLRKRMVHESADVLATKVAEKMQFTQKQ
jgi:hypothetical protein